MGRLEWNRELERQRAVLEHIMALLLALAAVADRAAVAPFAERLYVLDILDRGEAAARGLLAAMADGRLAAGAPVETIPALTRTQDDPALLAASLRTLALALGFTLARLRAGSADGDAGPHAGSPVAPRLRSVPAGWAVRMPLPAHDTS